VLLLAAGCAPDGGAGAAYTAVDSAGVTIAQNALPDASRNVWRVDPEPAVDIGVLEGEDAYQLFDVADAARFADGTLVVANGGSKELRFYDASGRFLSAAGGEGEGPGEFRGMGNLAIVGDSVHAHDYALSRIAVFTRGGEFVRSFRVELPGGDPAWVLDALPDGRWLVTKSFVFSPSDVSLVARDTLPYMLIGADGTFLDTLTLSPGVEFFVVGTAQSASASSLVFGRSTQYAVAPGRLYLGDNDRYEILGFAPSGTLELIVRSDRAPVAVGAAEIEAVKAERLEEAPSDNWRRNLERLFADMPIPSTLPAFDGLAADPAGHLWVMEASAPTEGPRTWSVFDHDGRRLGGVETPAGLTVREIGEDHVLGTWRDEMGVEHVRVHTLMKGEE
jgi:hypothetical protein